MVVRPERVAFWGVLLLAVAALGLGLSYGACTQDDAFISLRYADHLVRGHGLVYNVGDPVEGYTNLSWTLLLAGLLAVGADPVVATLVLGLGSLLAAVVATAWVDDRRSAMAVLAAAFVALDPMLVLEAVEGLETVGFAALGALALGLVLRGKDLASGLVLSLACLTRPEGVHLAGLVYVGLCLDALVRRTGDFGARFRRGLVAAAPVVATLVLLTAWRVAYYGDPLPNTFYAKTGGLAFDRGLHYLLWWARDRPLLVALVALRLVLGRPGRSTVPALTLVGGYLLYVAAVGGDFKPTGRFVIPVLPAMALLAAQSAELLARRVPRAALAVGAVVGLAFTLVTLQPEAAKVARDRHSNLQARRLAGIWLNQHTPPDTVLAIHSAGVLPFYADRVTIDMWGLTDRHIARTEPDDFGTGMAGHEKSDPAYVFGRQPDLYLPEDDVIEREPRDLVPGEGFPADFLDHYEQRSFVIEGVVLNLWMNKRFKGRWR